MESIWTGTVEDSYFNGKAFDKNRIIQYPENEYSGRTTAQQYYILSVDVGRKHDQSVISVIKVRPQSQGESIKELVNIFTLNEEHFEKQAIFIKQTYYKYNARRIIIDINGPGLGLLDYMVTSQTDPDTDEKLPSFGLYNDPTGFYRKYETSETELNAIYQMKANPAINTVAHSNLQTQLSSGKIKFLIEDKVARTRLLGTKFGMKMSPEERDTYLMPYTLTTILKIELMNLRLSNEGANIILKRANQRIGKDKFSSLEYGLYYIKQEEEHSKRKKRFNAKEWKFCSNIG